MSKNDGLLTKQQAIAIAAKQNVPGSVVIRWIQKGWLQRSHSKFREAKLQQLIREHKRIRRSSSKGKGK